MIRAGRRADNLVRRDTCGVALAAAASRAAHLALADGRTDGDVARGCGGRRGCGVGRRGRHAARARAVSGRGVRRRAHCARLVLAAGGTGSPDEGPLPAGRAGQHILVRVRVAAGTLHARPYSMSAPPDGGASVTITVKLIRGGVVSNALHAARVGDELLVGAPRGEFVAPPSLVPSRRPVLLLRARALACRPCARLRRSCW